MEDIVCATQPLVSLERAMHQILEEERRGRAVLFNDYGLRFGSLVETDGENLQRAGPHHADPRRVAAVGELSAHSNERGRVAFCIPASIHEIEQRGALM